ncbi:carbohydrate ABC transporter permease [Paenibacillus aceris]|uniref:Aldouronate transport system permease protein n=1 Tax=Paenibacillus aceris TaxID=869555 RepID=A0ABS4HWV2_9BACL|nr:carbohydrate ABC transporter permease [Paenibacillus aceris]MBP1963102.1 putative aldouronate transport system permease protein [Paenibacillus aceris]NHW38778.1 carbohydrate ABC transporter permease [Paenibacillus aceris]
MEKTVKIKEPLADKILLTIVHVVLFLILVIVLYPLIYIVSSSISSPQAVVAGRVWLFPVELSLKGYTAVLNNPRIWSGYYNSLLYTGIGTLISVSLTIALAYPLSKRTFHGRKLLMYMIMITMIFSGGLIPYYLTVKDLGLIDTRWALLLPQAVAVWQVFIAKTFFEETIPEELNEAAQLDGCSDFKFLSAIALPLSKPIIAVLVLMYAIANWNAYFDALIFLRKPDLFPLQLILREILIQNSVDNTMMVDVRTMEARQGMKDLLKFSLIVVSSLPVLIIYPFVQQYFVKGVMIGSLKG